MRLVSQAVVIVSGDKDLTVLDPWRGVRVLRPAQFLDKGWDKTER